MTDTNGNKESIGRRLRRGVVRILWVMLLLGIGVMLFLYYGSFSEGTRSGVVIKMSKRGMLFKTWEGQLNLQSFGALEPGGNQLNEVFNFSVGSGKDSLCSLLEDVSLTGERVRLDYVERYVTFPWRGETKYFVTGVQRSGKQVDISTDRSPVGH
jgi:hypothetical protein